MSKLFFQKYVKDSFYAALKTKGFVILAGLSGTGKTKIFEEFVKLFPLIQIEKKMENEIEKKWLEYKTNPDIKEKINSYFNLIQEFQEEYDIEKIKDLTLEDWKDFCYELEKGKYKDIAHIGGHGGSGYGGSYKFGIFQEKSTLKFVSNDFIKRENIQESFIELKKQLQNIFTYAKSSELDKIEKDIKAFSNTVKRKLAFMWNQDLIYKILADTHQEKILKFFGQDFSKDFIEGQKKIKEIHQNIFKDNDKLLFVSFLYSIRSLWDKDSISKNKTFKQIIPNNLFLSIRPDFKDSKSLLGYYNPLKKEYESTPLLKIILEARANYEQNKTGADPFFILFDEMNLARVEYYFADFLSVLESTRDADGFTVQSLKLHNSSDIEDIPGEIKLPPNLYFVGSVNIDETTHMFSPKVLDRAFTIEFDVERFEKYQEFIKVSKDNIMSGELKEQMKKDFTANGKFAVIDKNSIKAFVEKNSEYTTGLDKLNNILKPFNLHFGYRVFDEIMMFLYQANHSKIAEETLSFEDNNEAFDLAIKMKVLPKFHGTKKKLLQPVKSLLTEFCEIQGNIDLDNLSGIPQLETDDNNISRVLYAGAEIKTAYPHTARKLLEMLYKLQTDGFAGFM